MASNTFANDAMIRKLERELRERESFANGIIERAQNADRDLSDDDRSTLTEVRNRMEAIKDQLDSLEGVAKSAAEAANRARQIDTAIAEARNHVTPGTKVEYRSAGEWVMDTYKAHLGDRQATERLEMFHRTADHQKTTDNLGVVPDPIVGGVVNFIDSARPIVNILGARPLPGATWYRPHVLQHTSVTGQGTTGALNQQKVELASQKMTIERLTGNAVTYGGYVNVSRQDIDFSQPQILDLVINDLAAQYAIETEAATATAIAGTATGAVAAGSADAAGVAGAVWEAAATAYNAVRGQGSLVLAVAPDVLSVVGPLFAPVNPVDAQSTGFTAGSFGQGVLGTISGIRVVMSSGLASGDAYLFSTACVEVYETRIGQLQALEPSVLGLQVAYAGYFAPLVITDDAIIPITGLGGGS